MAGAVLDRLVRAQRLRPAGALVAGGLLLWSGIDSIRAYPNHMSYMNELTAGRPTWWLLSDSNVEWGDDVKELAEWLHARGETQVRAALLLGGEFTLETYGVHYVSLIRPDDAPVPKTRYVALGASYLNGSTVPSRLHGKVGTYPQFVNFFDAYRTEPPETVIGGSIYVYREEP